MPRGEEYSLQLLNKIVKEHEAGKGFRKIVKEHEAGKGFRKIVKEHEAGKGFRKIVKEHEAGKGFGKISMQVSVSVRSVQSIVKKEQGAITNKQMIGAPRKVATAKLKVNVKKISLNI